MTTPSGHIEVLSMDINKHNMLTLQYIAKEIGLYAFEDTYGTRHVAMVGDLTSLEMNTVIASPQPFDSIAQNTGGQIIWLEDNPEPIVRYIENARRYGGSNWIAFKRNQDFTVTGVNNTSLLPAWLCLIVLLGGLVLTWWREGRNHA